MTSLAWRVKDSLVAYVRVMADGAVDVVLPAVEEAGEFLFPAISVTSDLMRFTGAVLLRGHGGMLDIPLREPWLVRSTSGWDLTIEDPDAPGGRLCFATIAELLVARASGDVRAHGTALAEDGAGLFFGPYEVGTLFDNPRIVFDSRAERVE